MKLLELIDSEETLFIVWQYLSGEDEFTHLEAKGHKTDGEARGPFRQLVSALQHCHQGPRGHRDLKPGKLVLDTKNNAKISTLTLATSGPQERSQTLSAAVPCSWPQNSSWECLTQPQRWMRGALEASCTPWQLYPSPLGDKVSGSCGSVCFRGQ